MTRLDRAFIKAYSKTTAATPSPHLDLAAADAALPPAPAGDIAVPRLDGKHAQSEPHWAPGATSTFTTWDTVGEFALGSPETDRAPQLPMSDPIDRGWRDPAPTFEPLPTAEPPQQVRIDLPSALNTAANEPSKAPSTEPLPEVESEPATQSPSWRAAFEVDSLLWPEVNYSLAAACRGQWEHLMKEFLQASRDGQKVVLVSSYQRGEGRTSLVLCLAQLLSQKQKRVAVVDADFQRPQIARQLKLLPACGWDEVVRDAQPLTEAWIESVSDGVTLLPLDKRADTTGLTGNPRLKQLFEALRSQHDVVLIDAGAISDSNDREMLALLAGTAQIDSAMLVRDVRSTSWDTLHDSQKCLDAIGIGRWDVVENFAD